MAKFYHFIFLFLSAIIFVQAQDASRKVLHGKIMANSADLDNINIINLQADLNSVSESGGYFSIPAKEGDTLMFSAVYFKALKVIVKDEHLNGLLFFVKMEILSRQLDEVSIKEYQNINAVSLGILSKPAKKYTPAERKLRAAGELHWYSPLLIPVGGMSVDGLINSISGRTAMLKKEVLVERKELLLKKITNQFQEDYFTETLHIPADHVKGFQYYLLENAAFESAMNDKNKTMATFIMNGLATDYLQLIEKK